MSKLLEKLRSKDISPRLASLCIRLGLAFVFAYAAIDSLIHPNDWVGYMPHILTNFIDVKKLLLLLSIYQLVLVAWLLIGKYARYAAILCALTLAGITIADLSVFSITFRDVGLFLAALGLAFLERG